MIKFYQTLLAVCLISTYTGVDAQAKKEKSKEIAVYQCLKYTDSIHIKQTEVSFRQVKAGSN